jgi:phosphate transport system substrate-binding protein
MCVRATLTALAAAALLTLAHPAMAAEITGAGSTFVFPVLARWAEVFAQQEGVHVIYQPIGSSAGITHIKAGTVDFGASDAPLTPAQLRLAGLVQFPLVIGGVVPVVHLEGISAGQIRFTGALLADIYLGKIRRWDDPAIAAVNPGVRFPDQPITVVLRSDGSGTTFNWVSYLSRVSDVWKQRVGEGTSVIWPTGVGGRGNGGVADYVGRTPGAIGYVEYAYALQHKMAYGLVQNSAGVSNPAPTRLVGAVVRVCRPGMNHPAWPKVLFEVREILLREVVSSGSSSALR